MLSPTKPERLSLKARAAQCSAVFMPNWREEATWTHTDQCLSQLACCGHPLKSRAWGQTRGRGWEKASTEGAAMELGPFGVG